jgi:hypothetical protein
MTSGEEHNYPVIPSMISAASILGVGKDTPTYAYAI